MADVEYRTNLAKFHTQTLIFEGEVKLKEKNVIKITRSNKIRKEQYKILILNLHMVVNQEKKSFLCNHVNIFLNKNRSDDLEIGDIIQFKGRVKKYKSYKQVIENLILQVDNYGICKIQEIKKVGKVNNDIE